MYRKFFIICSAILLLFGCDRGKNPMEPIPGKKFKLTIENISSAKMFSASGIFNTPVGKPAPAPIGPGEAYEFNFSAAPGAKLSFATMFVHSNDLFYAPGEAGISLFNNGVQVTGDLTSQIKLWDAGTEVNQEPGLGADQAPRQAGPNTGALDANNLVREATDDFTNLPLVSDVIKVMLTSTSETGFNVRIENVSNATTLKTSDGNSHAVPLAPGVWVVHGMDAPLFTPGQQDKGKGLEAIAEDGNPANLGNILAGETGITQIIAPGVWAVHSSENPLFTNGAGDRGEGLEALAEDGDPSSLSAALTTQSGISSSDVFNTPVGASMPGPVVPGSSYEFYFEAKPSEYLSFATMFVQSNDLFYSPNGMGIKLFDNNGMPIVGEITAQIMLWDAGTEINEEPGIGLNQAPRQSGPNTGADENGVVQLVNDGFNYPKVSDVIRVTIATQ